MTARSDILDAIRVGRPAWDSPQTTLPAYRTSLDEPPEVLAALLASRLADYGVAVLVEPTPSALPPLIARRLAESGIRHVVVPPGLPEVWMPPEAVVDTGAEAAGLDAAEGALTGCLLAVAESGTIVLDGTGACGRRALTLLPDYHLCVVLRSQIVGILPEAMPALRDAVRRGPLTFISGPSATADIELDRVQGVHGPRVLDVIIAAG
jgi:L-lactate dehydrogenase complex protein LldG